MKWILPLLVALSTTMSAEPESCARTPVAQIPGDVIIGGLFPVHERGKDGRLCGGRINGWGIQTLEAFMFAIDTLNSANFTPGVTFGGLAYDTCEQTNVASQASLQFLGQRELNRYGHPCEQAPLHIGTVGPHHSGPSMKVAAIMTSAKMPQISYAATATPLGDKRTYPYFLRTVPPSKIYIQVLMDVLVELEWSHVAMVTQEDSDAQDRKSELIRTASKRNICVVKIITLSSDFSNMAIVLADLVAVEKQGIKGIVLMTDGAMTTRLFEEIQGTQIIQPSLSRLHWVMGLPFHDGPHYNALKTTIRGLISIVEYSRDVVGFKEYFNALTLARNRRNPWFRAYLEQTYNCTVGVSCVQRHRELHNLSYQQANYVAQTVAAVYSYAHALRQAHMYMCANISGVCNALSRISSERLLIYLKEGSFVGLDNEVVSFDDAGEINNLKYSIRNIQLDGVAYSLKEVGRWTGRDGLNMITNFKFYAQDGSLLPSYPPSVCHEKCVCRNEGDDYSYGTTAAGDFLLLGMFDLHSSGSGVKDCGKRLHEGSVQALEAMYYAIDLININNNILPHVKLSAVAMDTCRNKKRSARQLSQLMTGHLKVKSRDGLPLAVSALLGAGTSEVSMELAKSLASQKVPVISYAASTMELGDKSAYPYFLRTVGSDKGQVRAMLDIIKYYKWKYVKVLYSDTTYGISAAREFLRLAQMEDICVATQVQLSPYLTKDKVAMRNIVSYYLTEAFTEAKVVVMFTTDTHARAVLEAMTAALGNTTRDTIWLASDFWGSRESVTSGHEMHAAGAITLDFLSDHVPGFMQYFRNLHPTANTRNPWFEEFWQRRYKCFTSNSLSRLYSGACSPALSLATEHLTVSPDVPYVIDGVYTAALSLHKLLEDHCEANTTGVCPQAWKNMHLLYTYMRNLKFYNGITNLTVSYDALGNGVSRYNIMNYQGLGGSYDYQKVGEWRQGRLELHKEPVVGYMYNRTSNTPASAVRSQCPVSSCLCSDLTVSDLEFELRYARLTLLGYFPLHGKDASGNPCASFRTDAGFVPLMAFKYAIERVNKDPNLLPNVSLGYMVFDTCSDADYAGLSFNALDKNLRFFAQPPELPVITYVHAFIGGMEDDVTKALNKASDTGQRLVQLSSGSVSDSLSDPDKYYYFLRTTAPESNQARALVAIIRELGWTYISLFHTTSTRDIDLIARLEAIIAEKGICVATKEFVDHDSRNISEYEVALDRLAAKKGALGVIVVASAPEIRLLLETAKEKAMVGRFIWIGTDQWGDDLQVMAGLDDVARGSITLAQDTGRDPYFDSFMQRINPDYSSNSPWVKEFWQDYFQCELDYGAGYPRVCDGSETLRGQQFSSSALAINTINAVYAYAYGLTKLFTERCGGMIMPPCESITGETRTSTLVYEYIKRARFKGADGKDFTFTEDGNGVGRYRVLNFKMKTPFNAGAGNTMHRGRGFIQVGEWASDRLYLDKSLLHMYSPSGKRTTPISQCPGTCNCSDTEVWFDKETVPLKMHAHETVWGILVMTFSTLGSVMIFVVMIFFIFKFKHPVVVGSTASLSLMLLTGLLLMYLTTLSFMLTATAVTCGVRRAALPISHALVFAVLLIKVIRISRICNKASMSAKPSFVSGTSQSILSAGLVLVQVIMAIEWLLTQPAEVHWELVDVSSYSRYPSWTLVWHCNHTKRALMASLWFVMLLMSATVCVALRARRASNYQREAMWILVASGSTVIVTVAWTSIYVVADDRYSSAAVSVGITANASIILSAIFIPKMLALTEPKLMTGSDGEYDSNYAVPKRGKDKFNNHSHGSRNNPAFTIEASSSGYDPYCGIDMATFDR